MKKLLAFDLDDTLAITKSPISDQMGEVLSDVLEKFDVCVISGGRFEQFKLQIIDRLHIEPAKLSRLHLMPTCGTQYYRFNELDEAWEQQYAENLTEDEIQRTTEALESSARELGLWRSLDGRAHVEVARWSAHCGGR